MRTQEEIVERVNMFRQEGHVLEFRPSFLFVYLDFDHAKQFLKEDATEETWGEVESRERELIIKEMSEYMSFAWEKANNCRGISAMRSLQHYDVWTWLLDEHMPDLDEYEFYGKEHLLNICEKYGFTNEDDGERVNEG